MSFTLVDRPHTTGFYVYKGRQMVHQSCYKFCSKNDIAHIKEQIWKYTRVQPRQGVLSFANEKGECLYVYDNLSLLKINEMRDQNIAEFDIQEQNFYILMPQQIIR